MDEEPDPGLDRRTPFPGGAFWRVVESAASAFGFGSPRTIFRIRQVRARWEERRAASANLGRAVSYTHKTCPACSRLVERGKGTCPYCGASVRWAPGPGIARTLGLVIPHGSAAMTILTLNLFFFVISSLLGARISGKDLLTVIFQGDGRSLYNLGSLWAPAVVVYDEGWRLGEIWRLWTYQFLHGNALHIFFNSYALLSLGPTAEDVYGSAKMPVLYWVTGVCAGIMSVVMRVLLQFGPGWESRVAPSVGASGAIFGLIGLLVGHTFRRGGTQGANLRAFLVRWALYGLLIGMLPGIDNAAHIGGLGSGFLLGLLVPEGDPRSGFTAVFWRLAIVAVVALTVCGFAAAVFAPHA
jgi:membrane associated rhomboid family serine protease